MTWTITMAVGTRIRYRGEVHTVTVIEGSLVTFRSPRGRAWVADARHVLADPSTVVGAGPDVETAPDGVGELFANLTHGENEEIADRVAHLHEVLTGYRSGSADLAAAGEPRAAFHPELAVSERQQAKADELGVGVRTVQRWLAAFQADGPAGLLDGRHFREADPLRGLDQRWVDACRAVLDEHTDASRPSRQLLLERVEARLASVPRAGGAPAVAPRRPSGADRAAEGHQRLRRQHQGEALDRQPPGGRVRPAAGDPAGRVPAARHHPPRRLRHGAADPAVGERWS